MRQRKITVSGINIERLTTIMAKLRDPESGCPWDLKQNFSSIVPYTIEEVYEVADAIERNDYCDLKDELGDLLFQVVFYAQLASEQDLFELDDVVQSICEKLERRHPHVFGEQQELTEQQVANNWEKIKAQERQAKGADQPASLVGDIPKVLPELKKAQKIQSRVAKHGFDWQVREHVWEKLAEESEEIKQAAVDGTQSDVEEEIGDLLFVCVNLARHYQVDADTALRKANQKFVKRFAQVERLADKPIQEYSLDELEDFWQKSKSMS